MDWNVLTAVWVGFLALGMLATTFDAANSGENPLPWFAMFVVLSLTSAVSAGVAA